MTKNEKKALTLVNEICVGERGMFPYVYTDCRNDSRWEALCRAIEAHEAFRQEVSDEVSGVIEELRPTKVALLSRFIITEPDQLREICNDIGLGHTDTGDVADELRAALAARGLEIREIEK